MAVTEQPETRCCDECGSSYLASSSQMTHLRPECSHWLYGNPPCVHEFAVRPRVRRASTSSPADAARGAAGTAVFADLRTLPSKPAG